MSEKIIRGSEAYMFVLDEAKALVAGGDLVPDVYKGYFEAKYDRACTLTDDDLLVAIMNITEEDDVQGDEFAVALYEWESMFIN